MSRSTVPQIKDHYYRIGRGQAFDEDVEPADPAVHRQKIEPWLSAVFQSEHLCLLVGNGFSRAVSAAAGIHNSAVMDKVTFKSGYDEQIVAHAERTAKRACRATANVEDQIRAV